MRIPLLSLLCLVTAGAMLTLPGAAHAVNVVINNGLAPPSPDNVVDDATYSADVVWVRNVGCPPGWPSGNAYDPCPSPGAATVVGLVDGGAVSSLITHDSSSATISGGVVSNIVRTHESSSVTMTGGSVLDTVHTLGTSIVTITGGAVSVALEAHDSTTITIFGSGFQVDGVPVPYGDLTALTGALTGTLASGDPIDNIFYQGGGSWAGTVTLVEAHPTPALPWWGQSAIAAGLLGAAVMWWRKNA